MLDDARSIWELVERRAAATPDRVMLYDGDRATTFAEYRDLAERAAAGLMGLGVGAGVNVSWQLPTWTESAVLVGALCRLGAVQNPMLPIYRAREISFIAAADALPAADHAVGVEQLRLRVAGRADRGRERRHAHARRRPLEPRGRSRRRCRRRPPPYDDRADDPVRWIFYTSGTTAAPKGAQHTDRSVLAGAIGYAKKTHVVEDDIALVAFPFTHVGGIIIGVFTPLLTGSAAVLMEAWTPQASTELIRKHGVTLANGAAAIHAALITEAKADPDAYKTVRDFPSGGSARPPQLHDELKAVVPSSIGTTAGYGMTEAPIVSQTDIDDHEDVKRFAEGRPNEGVTMKLIDREGNEVPPGEEGEVVVKGPQVMRGYVDSSLDADAFTPDGFLHTGDLGRFDRARRDPHHRPHQGHHHPQGRERVGQGSRGRALHAPRDRRRRGARHPRRRPGRDGRRVRRARRRVRRRRTSRASSTSAASRG